MSSFGSAQFRSSSADEKDSLPSKIVIALALCVACAISVAYSILFIALAINGDEGISDNWVGYLAAYTLLIGMAVALVVFIAAIFLRRRHNRLPLLWLPTYLFPFLALTTLILELFVIE